MLKKSKVVTMEKIIKFGVALLTLIVLVGLSMGATSIYSTYLNIDKISPDTGTNITFNGSIDASGYNLSIDAITGHTLDTGQGANELFDMNQNVLTSSGVEFVELNLTGNLKMGDKDVYNATWVNSTGMKTTNLYATNLESNIDGTGYNITAANFSCTDCLDGAQIDDIFVFVAGDTLTGDLAMGNNDITGVKDLNTTDINASFAHINQLNVTEAVHNINLTSQNMTDVECILFQSGGKICTN